MEATNTCGDNGSKMYCIQTSAGSSSGTRLVDINIITRYSNKRGSQEVRVPIQHDSRILLHPYIYLSTLITYLLSLSPLFITFNPIDISLSIILRQQHVFHTLHSFDKCLKHFVQVLWLLSVWSVLKLLPNWSTLWTGQSDMVAIRNYEGRDPVSQSSESYFTFRLVLFYG